jgi:hypothetical protein
MTVSTSSVNLALGAANHRGSLFPHAFFVICVIEKPLVGVTPSWQKCLRKNLAIFILPN